MDWITIFFALTTVLFISLCFYTNNDWYKECKKINDDWLQRNLELLNQFPKSWINEDGVLIVKVQDDVEVNAIDVFYSGGKDTIAQFEIQKEEILPS